MREYLKSTSGENYFFRLITQKFVEAIERINQERVKSKLRPKASLPIFQSKLFRQPLDIEGIDVSDDCLQYMTSIYNELCAKGGKDRINNAYAFIFENYSSRAILFKTYKWAEDSEISKICGYQSFARR